MSERHLFVADVHLRREEVAKRDALIALIRRNARPGVHLYILGDLFDLWIGSVQREIEPEWEPLFEAFKHFVDAGGKFTIFHGNRDYMMGDDLTRTLGAETVGGARTIDLDGRKVFLTHGDMLCTGDQLYHVARRVTRGPIASILWSFFPLRWKVGFAEAYRHISGRQGRSRREARHGISRPMLRRLVRRGVDVVICGHIHEQTEHVFRHGGRELQVKTLADWGTGGTVLEYVEGGFTLRTVDFA